MTDIVREEVSEIKSNGIPYVLRVQFGYSYTLYDFNPSIIDEWRSLGLYK